MVQKVANCRIEAEASKDEEAFVDDILIESATLERQRRIWLAARSVLKEIDEEQMDKFQPREAEIVAKEHMEEEIGLGLRRERQIEEQSAIGEWMRDCQSLQNERQLGQHVVHLG
jgi:hypothetical protein